MRGGHRQHLTERADLKPWLAVITSFGTEMVVGNFMAIDRQHATRDVHAWMNATLQDGHKLVRVERGRLTVTWE